MAPSSVPTQSASVPTQSAPLKNRSRDARLAKTRAAPARPERQELRKPSEARAEPEAPARPPLVKPGCEPNFYLDAQGEKHFKPECF